MTDFVSLICSVSGVLSASPSSIWFTHHSISSWNGRSSIFMKRASSGHMKGLEAELEDIEKLSRERAPKDTAGASNKAKELKSRSSVGNLMVFKQRRLGMDRRPVKAVLAQQREMYVNPYSNWGKGIVQEKYNLRREGKAGNTRQCGRGFANKPQRKIRFRVRNSNSKGNYGEQLITKDDLNQGVLDLVDRGLVPRDVDFSPAFNIGEPPIVFRAVEFQEIKAKFVQIEALITPPIVYTISKMTGTSESVPVVQPENSQNTLSLVPFKQSDDRKTLEKVLEEHSKHTIEFKERKVVKSPEFEAFKMVYNEHASEINCVIRLVERALQRYGVNSLAIDGRKLIMKIAFELKEFRLNDLNDCLVNPGNIPWKNHRVYKIKEVAAVKIQTEWRKYSCKNQFKLMKMKNKKCGIIQRAFKLYSLLKTSRTQFKDKWENAKISYEQIQSQFKRDYCQIVSSKRVEIHLSFGSRKEPEEYVNYLTVSHAFLVKDPLVDVILVTLTPFSQEIKEYYWNLLETCGVAAARDRAIFYTPMEYAVMPTVSDVAALLYFSHESMREIKEIIGERHSYIIPSHLSDYTIRLSAEMGIPLYIGDVEIIQKLYSKTECVRILEETGVDVPVTAINIKKPLQFYQVLSGLIKKHLDVHT